MILYLQILNIGIMEKKMETEIRIVFRVYWGNIGIMEKKMETLGPFKGIYWGIY